MRYKNKQVYFSLSNNHAKLALVLLEIDYFESKVPRLYGCMALCGWCIPVGLGSMDKL